MSTRAVTHSNRPIEIIIINQFVLRLIHCLYKFQIDCALGPCGRVATLKLYHRLTGLNWTEWLALAYEWLRFAYVGLRMAFDWPGWSGRRLEKIESTFFIAKMDGASFGQHVYGVCTHTCDVRVLSHRYTHEQFNVYM